MKGTFCRLTLQGSCHVALAPQSAVLGCPKALGERSVNVEWPHRSQSATISERRRAGRNFLGHRQHLAFPASIGSKIRAIQDRPTCLLTRAATSRTSVPVQGRPTPLLAPPLARPHAPESAPARTARQCDRQLRAGVSSGPRGAGGREAPASRSLNSISRLQWVGVGDARLIAEILSAITHSFEVGLGQKVTPWEVSTCRQFPWEPEGFTPRPRGDLYTWLSAPKSHLDSRQEVCVR